MTDSRSAPAFNPPPRSEQLDELLSVYPTPLFGDQLYRSIELMERYSIDCAIDILSRLGVFEEITAWQSAAELCHRLSLQPMFTFALDWLLRRVVETDCLEMQIDAANPCYRLQGLPWAPDVVHLRAAGLEIDSANVSTLDLIDRASSLYPAVARGEQSGEQALFGSQGIPFWLNYFSNKNPTYAVNNWVAAVAATQRLSRDKPLRILELGAGGGSASEILLGCLEAVHLLPKLENYVITEPNAFFLRRGQRELCRKYATLPLQWRHLDMNESWSEQGIEPAAFDLIFGVNVLHVANDLIQATQQAHQALKPNGWLVIGECVRPLPRQPIYIELVFQLLDSFTGVLLDPELRPNPGFLTPEQWKRLFTCSGFSHPEVTPDIPRIRAVYPHFFTAAICGQRG